jgi:hypothetical protein
MPSEGYETAAWYEIEPDARAAAETLTLRGVGATWEPSGADPPGYHLVVVEGDAVRARAILGVAEPEPDAAAMVERRRRERPQWLYALLIVLGALVVIPLVAFYFSYKLAGG